MISNTYKYILVPAALIMLCGSIAAARGGGGPGEGGGSSFGRSSGFGGTSGFETHNSSRQYKSQFGERELIREQIRTKDKDRDQVRERYRDQDVEKDTAKARSKRKTYGSGLGDGEQNRKPRVWHHEDGDRAVRPPGHARDRRVAAGLPMGALRLNGVGT